MGLCGQSVSVAISLFDPNFTKHRLLCHGRGVLNVVHGTRDVVNNILDHPDIKAVSFVGSNAAGRYISERASANGKRVQVSPLSLLAADTSFTNLVMCTCHLFGMCLARVWGVTLHAHIRTDGIDSFWLCLHMLNVSTLVSFHIGEFWHFCHSYEPPLWCLIASSRHAIL